MRRPSPLSLMVGAAASWATATVTTKVTLEVLTPVDLLAVEVLVGAAAVWIVVWIRGAPVVTAGSWTYARLGILEPAATFALFDLGIDRTGAADAAVLVASDGVFSVTLAWLLLRERSNGRTSAAIALGFAGAVVVGLGGSGGQATLGGDALVLASAATAALYGVGARRIATDAEADSLAGTAWQLLAALLAIAPIFAVTALSGHSRLGSADAPHLLAALATGVLGSAIPFLLFNTAIGDIAVSASVVILNLIPVIGAGLAVVLLGDHLGVVQLLGAAAVVASAFAVERSSVGEPVLAAQ
jgi:drug/metabolite transporter (DMT)-like permease